MDSKMEYHGPFGGTITHHGHLLDTIKSSLQKYIRRNETEKAIRCALELDRFYLLGDKTKGIRTNMINRLRIISCEEFADSNWGMVPYVDKFIKSWLDNRDGDRIIASSALINLITTFAQVKKSRMMSFIRAAYKYGWNVAEIKAAHFHLYDAIDNSVDIEIFKKDGDPDCLSEYMGKFVYYFKQKSHKCFYWAFKIMEIKEKCSRRFRRTGSEYILWDYLLNDSKKYEDGIDQIVNIYFNWYKTCKSENWMYLINAIKISLRDNIGDTNFTAHSLVNNISEIDKIVNDHLNKDFQLDDYCIDQHTSKGRGKKRGAIHFAEVGSLVEDESPSVNKEYKKIYMKLKYLSVGKVYKTTKTFKIKKSNKNL